jgi:hypothetical protein
VSRRERYSRWWNWRWRGRSVSWNWSRSRSRRIMLWSWIWCNRYIWQIILIPPKIKYRVRFRILIIILGFDCKVNGREGCRWWGRTRWSSESRKIALIKLSMLRDNGFLGSGVEKQPTLVSSGVTNENTFLHVGLEQFLLILLYIDIGSTPSDSEMLDIRLILVPIVVRGVRSISCWNAIPDMNMCS